jgi:hypothetical protein
MKSKKIRWAGQIAGIEEINAHTLLDGKSRGNKPLRTSKRRWENNITKDLNEIRCGAH